MSVILSKAKNPALGQQDRPLRLGRQQRITMIISNYLKIRLLKPAEERIMARGRAEERAQSEKRIAETRAEANRKVAEWNRRRLAAQERGEPFDEPPPDLTQP